MTIKTIEVALDFYKVYRCGYYEFRSPSAKFGGLQSTLEQLKEWVKGKTLGDTKLWDNLKESNKSDGLPVYIFGIESNQHGCVIGVWNEVLADSDNRVGAAAKNDHVGQVKVNLKGFGMNEIPGYPTYFWFLPSKNLFATVRLPSQRKTLQPKLEQYINVFLTHETQEAVYEQQATENDKIRKRKLIGYRKNGSDSPVEKVDPRYEVGRLKKKTDTAWLIEHADRVRKLHCKSSLTKRNKADSTFYFNMIRSALQRLNWSIESVPTRASLKTSFTVELSQNQVRELIENHGEQDSWDDYGLQFDRDDTIHWLSGTSVKEHPSLDVILTESGVVDLPSLLSALTKQQEHLSTMAE